jgi:hypothetical protein
MQHVLNAQLENTKVHRGSRSARIAQAASLQRPDLVQSNRRVQLVLRVHSASTNQARRSWHALVAQQASSIPLLQLRRRPQKMEHAQIAPQQNTNLRPPAHPALCV